MAIRLTLITALTLLGTVHFASAAPPERTAQLTFDSLDGMNTCLGWSTSTRTMLCFDARANFVDELDAIWVPLDGEQTGISLIEDAGANDASGKDIRYKADLRRINRSIKKYGFTVPKLLWQDEEKGPAKLSHGVTVHRSGLNVLFMKGKSKLHSLSLAAPEDFQCDDTDGVHTVEVEVFSAGPEHVVVGLAHGCKELAYSTGKYHVVRLTPVGCPKNAHCPPTYSASRQYLDHVCQGTLVGSHIAELKKQTAAGSIAAIDLQYLYNAVRALRGHRFKKPAKLNRFFYAKNPTWLPKSCRCMPPKAGSPGTCAVKATHRKAQRNLKKLWKSVRSRLYLTS